MTNTKPRTDIFEIVTDILMVDYGGKEYYLTGKNANVQVMSLVLYESLETPYMMGEIAITDSGVNLIGLVPITGMEKITFGVKTPYFSDVEYKYEMYVSSVRNRVGSGRVQTYVLDLISYEGLQNEAIRIGKIYSDYGNKIVQDIMKTYFKTNKKVDAESCKYQMKFIPRGQRPFDLIYSMLPKCISSDFSSNTDKGMVSSVTKKSDNISGQTDVNPIQNISGSAGYFFWETYDGFKFKSIDKLCSSEYSGSDGDKIKDTFVHRLGKIEGNKDPGRNILEYQYSNEIDVLKKMRYGTYSSMMVFFNPSTGQYEEYVFKMDESYNSMVHLGKDEKIPEGPKQLSKYPTRIMTQIIDHETFYNGSNIASPDPKDNDKSGTQFPDYKKYYMSQSIARKLLLNNQEMKVTICGNLSLRAGDKINILLPNYSVEDKRTTEQYDKQHSGTYLIKDISYEFYLTKNNQSNLAVTNLTLVRDSFGAFTLQV